MRTSESSGYELVLENGGDPIVVEDIIESDLYSEEIDAQERYEVRQKGIRLGRFEDMEEVQDFLDEAKDNSDLHPVQ